MTDPSERLKKWFVHHYEHEQFRLSMQETRLDVAGFNTILGFLAQGVAQACYGEERYLLQLVTVYHQLRTMIEDLQKVPGHDTSSQFHYPLILGVLMEMAIGAVTQLKKEDRGD